MSLLLALPKGRIMQESLQLLTACGLQIPPDIASSRKLIFNAGRPDVEMALLRAQDVIAYVDSGAADFGIVGLDLIREHEPENLYTMVDLRIGVCKLVTAKPRAARSPTPSLLRVATKYPKIARKFYASIGQQIQPIKLYGSMEIAPALNIADEIVDVVSTGNTLKANELEVGLAIMDVSSYLVVNKNALKTKHSLLQPLIESFRRHAH